MTETATQKGPGYMGTGPVGLLGAAPWVASSTTHPSSGPANQRGTWFVGWGRGTAKLLDIRQCPISSARPAVAPFTPSYDRGQGPVGRARGQMGWDEIRGLRFFTNPYSETAARPSAGTQSRFRGLDEEAWMKANTTWDSGAMIGLQHQALLPSGDLCKYEYGVPSCSCYLYIAEGTSRYSILIQVGLGLSRRFF